ncbi:MAG: hypothetical protein GY712_04895, partial [Oceanicoccus sp.]|uniref:hypothetical protein n=1 Tax=Oceanicoccus sp. TaxID=2691044 RepID=UPI00262FD638
MYKTIYLDINDIPPYLRNIGGYKGRKFEAIITSKCTLTGTNWSGGSRSRYTLVRLNDGKQGGSFGGSDAPAPWSNKVEGREIDIPIGYAVVEHDYFRGKDMGLTFYINPENATAMLPAKDDSIDNDEKAVLYYTSALKNSYGGRSNIRFAEANKDLGITVERWEKAKA